MKCSSKLYSKRYKQSYLDVSTVGTIWIYSKLGTITSQEWESSHTILKMIDPWTEEYKCSDSKQHALH